MMYAILLLHSTCLVIITTGLQCPRGGYRGIQPQFGPECMYRCHCVGDVQCDNDTGACKGGCAGGWMGPGCQYGDIVYQKTAWQVSQRFSYAGAEKAVDGNMSSCSETNQTFEPWWRVDLNAVYRITGLEIHSSGTEGLKSIEVRVGNISSNSSADFLSTCFNHSVNENISEVTYVLCTSVLIGNHLIIWMPGQQTTMKLCDVRIYGGRSVAYRRFASQASVFDGGVASLAVDGGISAKYNDMSCTQTTDEQSPWWRVDLVQVYSIIRIVIINRGDCCAERLSGFSVSFATNNTYSLVFKYPDETPKIETEITTLSQDLAQKIEISLKQRTVYSYLTLWEVFVFGECQYNLCGWTCDTSCYCKGPIDKQNKIGANCPDGCKTGWWGYSCNFTCDTNCKGNTCNQNDGHCFECLLGKWGHFCNNDCTNCINGTGCENSNGTCTVGCLTGLYGVSCDQDCGHCADDGSCNRYTGACNHGCQPGWQEENCIIACSRDWYGFNCNNMCGHCANITCDHINGTCPLGCSEGYNGTRCFERLRKEKVSTESSSALTVGVPVGVALGAAGLSIIIILVAVMLWKRRKRVSERSQPESTYDQIDSTHVEPNVSSDYSKIEELGLSSVIPKESKYVNIPLAKTLIPKCEFKDMYQHYVSLDDQTGELKLLSVFKNMENAEAIEAKVTRTRRADVNLKQWNKTYLFEVTPNESTILSGVPTTSEAFWRIALERKIHLIIIIGENHIHFKPNVKVDIGLIQIECVGITIERDHQLCNLNVTGSEKEAKVRNVQVILVAEEYNFCISSDINKTVAVLEKRLRMREGIEVFNTLINCTPDVKGAECFVASLFMIDAMERSGYVDITGIIRAMRKQKEDVIDSFERFKFCHDVIFKWIVDEDK